MAARGLHKTLNIKPLEDSPELPTFTWRQVMFQHKKPQTLFESAVSIILHPFVPSPFLFSMPSSVAAASSSFLLLSSYMSLLNWISPLTQVKSQSSHQASRGPIRIWKFVWFFWKIKQIIWTEILRGLKVTLVPAVYGAIVYVISLAISIFQKPRL